MLDAINSRPLGINATALKRRGERGEAGQKKEHVLCRADEQKKLKKNLKKGWFSIYKEGEEKGRDRALHIKGKCIAYNDGHEESNCGW